MKKILIIIGLVALLALFVGLWINQIQETKRVKTNLDIEYKQELDRQQTITKRELKKYYDYELELLKQHGIKYNHVENIIRVKYNFKDTLIQKDTLIFRDSIIYDNRVRFAQFDVESNCTRIIGNITDSIIDFEHVSMNDSLLISLYKEKRKCLFKKREIKAIAISECKGDTLAILRNLKVGK